MFVKWIWDMLDSLQYAFFASIPTFETPVWIVENLPTIISKIVSFNYYLPVSEALIVVISMISITFSWKIIKVVLGLVGINLNA